MPGSYYLTLAGQDITDTVLEPSIQVVSNLGQGPGVMGKTSGRATTATFLTRLGPTATAYGAGQTRPAPNILTNHLTANQSNIETDLSGFSNYNDALLSGSQQATITRDPTMAWQGGASLRIDTGAITSGNAGVEINPGVAIPAGTVVTISCYYYTNGTGGALRLWDFTNNNSPNGGLTLTTPTSGGWTRAVVTYTQAQATSDLRFAIRSGSAHQTLWVDGLQVEFANAASAWQVGYTPLPVLVRQGEVLIKDYTGTIVFGGYATKFDDKTDKTTVYTQVNCHDYWQALDRIVVNVVYTGQSDTAIINNLVTTYAPWLSLSQVNLATTNATFDRQVFRARTLQEALQRIADATGFDIWVDPQKRLHYQAPSSEPSAAYAVSDSNAQINNTTVFPAKVLAYSRDDNAVINRVTFYGGNKPTSDFTQDISSQANGSNTTFALAYHPHESSDGHIHVTVGGVQQVVGFTLSTDNLKSAGGTCDVLVDRNNATLLFNTAPATGAVVQALYRYNTPLVVQLTNQASFAFFGSWYDGKIADNSVFETSTAIARSRTLLAEQAYGLEQLRLQTYQPGLVVGTLMQVDHNVRGIHGLYRIQSVTAAAQGNGFFVYTVQLGAWDWHIADLLLAAARWYTPDDANQDENTTPLQVDTLTITVGAHTSVSATPHVSGWYYARGMAVGDGHDAYAGLFTVAATLPTAAHSNSSPGLGGGFGASATVLATGHVA